MEPFVFITWLKQDILLSFYTSPVIFDRHGLTKYIKIEAKLYLPFNALNLPYQLCGHLSSTGYSSRNYSNKTYTFVELNTNYSNRAVYSHNMNEVFKTCKIII